jgi:hypothetical protein
MEATHTASIELSIREEEKLTAEQELIITLIYKEAYEAAEMIMENADLPPVVKVTKAIAALMSILEKCRLNGSKISGQNKKVVVLQLVKRLIKELVKNSEALTSLLTVMNNTAEHLLETLVDVSRGVNVVNNIIEHGVTKENIKDAEDCCFAFFKN